MTDSVSLKQCSRKENCVNPLGSWLPETAEYFYSSKRGKNGLHAQCKKCRGVTSQKWADAHPEKTKEIKQQSAAKHKDSYRAIRLARYKTDARVREGRQAINDAWRKRNPDRVAEMYKRRYARERGAIGTHSLEDVESIRVGQNNRCWWCDSVLVKFEVDHRIPISKGGSDDASNLCLTCVTCNRSKGAKLPQEWNGRLL